MFFTLKKRTIAVVTAVCLAAVAGCLALSRIQPVGGKVNKIGKTVVIDAGHGGIDGGVVGVNTGVKESEINLIISKLLAEYLAGAGYDVVLTRKNEDALKTGKLKDMEARRDVIKKAAPDLVVSIHQNKYPRAYVKGVQVFYAPDGEDKAIADIMQKLLNNRLDGRRSAAKGDYYIIQCCDVPSLLIECGFLSNPDEEALLITGEYQLKVAYAIYTGIRFILEDEGGL